MPSWQNKQPNGDILHVRGLIKIIAVLGAVGLLVLFFSASSRTSSRYVQDKLYTYCISEHINCRQFPLLRGQFISHRPRPLIQPLMSFVVIRSSDDVKRSANEEELSEAHDHEAVVLDNSASYIQLHNGVHMPMVGMGTAALSDGGYSIMAHGVTHGFQLLDTASDTGPWYHTEKSIGKLIKDYELQRADLFITTKLHPQDFGAKASRASFENSLRNLDTDYIDLYLLHYPECWGDLCANKPEGTVVFGSVAFWRLTGRARRHLERCLEAIGGTLQRRQSQEYRGVQLQPRTIAGPLGCGHRQASRLCALKQPLPKQNFRSRTHLLLQVQNWFDPFHQEWDLIKFCRSEHIVFQAYSPLGSQWRKPRNPIFSDPTITALATKYNKSAVQITLYGLASFRLRALCLSSSSYTSDLITGGGCYKKLFPVYPDRMTSNTLKRIWTCSISNYHKRKLCLFGN